MKVSVKTPILIAIAACVLSFSNHVSAQSSNGQRPAYQQDVYRYTPALSDPNRLNGPDFEVMQAQARLAAAQQSYPVRKAETQTFQAVRQNSHEPKDLAQPDAPDQSDLLKDSKDPVYIVKNFRTMWVDARGAQYFGTDQMKAALGDNKEFRKLNIHIVDDPRVADVLLEVGYTFAWDYPFQLKHQNTTIVLLSGKGVGPFSGSLGAADVARELVNAVKHARKQATQPATKPEQPKDEKKFKSPPARPYRYGPAYDRNALLFQRDEPISMLVHGHSLACISANRI